MGGMSWLDEDGDGLLHPLEIHRVPGVTITATNLSSGSVSRISTDPLGIWTMDDMPAGTYQIEAGLIPGLVHTTAPMVDVTLLPGDVRVDINFGYISPTAVDLASFTAQLQPDGVEVQWQTSMERDSAGYYLHRSPTSDSHGKRVSPFIPAAALAEGASYRYLDTGVREGGWYYWLEAVDTAGESEFFGPIAVLDPGDPGGGYQLHLGLILR